MSRDKYDLTCPQREQRLQEQDGKCKLCQRPVAFVVKGPRAAVVDHDHVTGRVRGILCRICNNQLGYVERLGLKNIEAYLQPQS